ncbi:hypothetical protein KJ966_14660 [bacterium]|nr:hypothetical protein [bacterium]
MIPIRKILVFLTDMVKQAVNTSFDLFKITVPIIIVTRILKQAGLIDHIGFILAPVMELVGLPGNMGLVWATALITNLYGGMIVFASLAPVEELTVAQVTVLSTMMLVAHSLPVELRIAQKAGPRIRVIFIIRLLGALAIGALLNTCYQVTNYLQIPNKAIWNPSPPPEDWFRWTVGELRNLGYIFLIILSLIIIMRILEKIKVTALLTRLLEPLLKLLGMSKNAAPITIIGMTMGIGYGGGLLIQESKSGRLHQKDIFFSFALMGLCHSMVEDTLLMMVIGGHLSGIFWFRIGFALFITFLLVKWVNRVSPEFFNRYLFRRSV